MLSTENVQKVHSRPKLWRFELPGKKLAQTDSNVSEILGHDRVKFYEHELIVIPNFELPRLFAFNIDCKSSCVLPSIGVAKM